MVSGLTGARQAMHLGAIIEYKIEYFNNIYIKTTKNNKESSLVGGSTGENQ